MSGIYLHIPFCKQACHYCNFHFSTSLRYKTEMIAAIVQELQLQKDFLGRTTIETIYLGGGTPSLLQADELNLLFQTIYDLFSVASKPEITLEANPDDLSLDRLQALRDSPVNRLSIGIQSFFEEDLRFMNRAHNAQEARQCVEQARKMGFEDLSIDLIYGSPTTSDEHWRENLRIMTQLDLPHLSAYCLTVEPKTALDHFVKTGKAPPVNETQAARQFEILLDHMEAANYIHYEISNFALEGRYSRHNSAYWKAKPYLGVGPAAHSYDGQNRQWNIAHNAKYLKAIQEGQVPYEKEILRPAQRYNEYLLTTLRTIWGSDLQRMRDIQSSFAEEFLKKVDIFLKAGTVERQGDIFRLSRSGKILADRITMELFTEEN